MQTAKRLERIPPYLFAELDRKKKEAIQRGVDVINLGVGDPDRPTPEDIIDALQREAQKPENHRYPDYNGSEAFRAAASNWLQRKFGVDVDPNSEVMALIGSKEGIAHICWAYIEEDTYSLVPDPAYPVYSNQTLLAGGTPYAMPLRAENDFLPDLEAIPEDVLQKARLMFLNYPNNPTAGVATLDFFEQAVDLARKHDFLLCHDAAYVELTFDDYEAPSILQVPGARDVAVEFHSLSKPYNMTGWRIGFVAGNQQGVKALGAVKTNTDSGQFGAVQGAAIQALENTPGEFLDGMAQMYKERRDAAIDGLRELGIEVPRPKGTFYVWAHVPGDGGSLDFVEKLITEAGVITSPGRAFGEYGEGYFRIALTEDKARIAEAIERMGQVL